MTLSHPKVIQALKRSFVCGWTDITGVADYAGTSGTHEPSYPAVKTTNCAGHHNVQMFFLTPEGKVLHCLPGFWEKDAFLDELALARQLGAILKSPKLSIVAKNRAFLDLQLGHALAHDSSTRTRSRLQGFDRFDMNKEGTGFQRTPKGFLAKRLWGPGLKTTDQVLHERMAVRPFLAFEAFDVASFVNMGKKAFDSHHDGCHGDHVGECTVLAAGAAAGAAPGGQPVPGQPVRPARPLRPATPAQPAQPAVPPVAPAPVLQPFGG